MLSWLPLKCLVQTASGDAEAGSDGSGGVTLVGHSATLEGARSAIQSPPRELRHSLPQGRIERQRRLVLNLELLCRSVRPR